MIVKELADKAINIKGKKYVLVSDRVLAFNEMNPNGCIQSKLLTPPDSDLIVIKAKVTPDIDKPDRYFTGLSQETVGSSNINKTSALENAETSAIGRALAMMGIGVIESIASADELNKAQNRGYSTVNQQGQTVQKFRITCQTCGNETESKFQNAKQCYPCWKKSN